MKPWIFSFLLLAAFAASGQEMSDKNVSETEMFSRQAGLLLEKQFVDIGMVKGVEIKVFKVKDLLSGKSVSSIRFEYTVRTAYTSDTKTAVIDSDEIDGLIKSIKAMQNDVFPTSRDVYTEVVFISRTGVVCGAYYDLEKRRWTPFLDIDKYRKATVFLTLGDMETFLGFIETAKTKM